LSDTLPSWRFDVVTLFPELFAPLLTSGITRRAFETGQVDVQLANPRDLPTATTAAWTTGRSAAAPAW